MYAFCLIYQDKLVEGSWIWYYPHRTSGDVALVMINEFGSDESGLRMRKRDTHVSGERG